MAKGKYWITVESKNAKTLDRFCDTIIKLKGVRIIDDGRWLVEAPKPKPKAKTKVKSKR